MKNSIKIILLAVTTMVILIIIGIRVAKNDEPTSFTYEIVKDTLYMKMDNIRDGRKKKCRVYFSKNGKAWDDYVEYNRSIINQNVSNIYFFPPDTLYILNIEGERLTDLRKTNLEIIDVLSFYLLIYNGDHYELWERLKYESDGKKVERFAPGTPRIANKLTLDTLLTKAPVCISIQPNLKGCSRIDTLGKEIPIAPMAQ